eukprot:04088_6
MKEEFCAYAGSASTGCRSTRRRMLRTPSTKSTPPATAASTSAALCRCRCRRRRRRLQHRKVCLGSPRRCCIYAIFRRRQSSRFALS